ncbi:MAG: DUF6786 family protein [Planctomycetota bacterium]|nr:DUF6786 family protein [Planctomycetota bacterium]
MTNRTICLLVFCSGFLALQGCCSERLTDFENIRILLDSNADTIVLKGETGSKLLVSPRLQGRIMTAKVGSVESTGLVPQKTISEGEIHEHFNNFGGIDRFWIGPEAGQYGVYFPKGAKELTRDNWQVPASFDKGAFEVIEKTEQRIQLRKKIDVTNLLGVEFETMVTREIGLIPSASLGAELGIELPAGVSYIGCYSDNQLTNTGNDWDPKSGLIGIWILGMFNASDQAVVIAPFKSADNGKPAYNDDYFGKVEDSRLKVIGQSVIFRGDARKVGKFGLSQGRTTGLAGSFDFGRNLLTVVRFSVPQAMERYGNSTWHVTQENPYSGDAFQSYNNGDDKSPDGLAQDAFFELESASPVRPLRKGENISHRHATYHFQGPRKELDKLAAKLLEVSLEEVQAAMWPSSS